MMKLKRYLIVIALLLNVSSSWAADIQAGVDYVVLNEPVPTSNPDKVVVTELFWYGCPHCFRLEPYIEKWNQTKPEGVVFEQVPSVLNPGWMEDARTYFALQMMGENAKVHSALFNALHIQHQRLNNLDAMAKFVASLGVDEKQFRDNYYSFPVDTLIRKTRQKERKYGHNGVPAIVVNGKYRTGASMAGSNARLIEVINYLVDKELKAEK
jgi:protein dithiol oxidoreductase (disulfide-forming)